MPLPCRRDAGPCCAVPAACEERKRPWAWIEEAGGAGSVHVIAGASRRGQARPPTAQAAPSLFPAVSVAARRQRGPAPEPCLPARQKIRCCSRLLPEGKGRGKRWGVGGRRAQGGREARHAVQGPGTEGCLPGSRSNAGSKGQRPPHLSHNRRACLGTCRPLDRRARRPARRATPAAQAHTGGRRDWARARRQAGERRLRGARCRRVMHAAQQHHPAPRPPPPPLSQQHPPRSWVPVHNRVSVVRLRPVPASPRWLPCLLPPSPSPCHHNPQKHRPPTPPYQRVGRRRIKGVPPARLGAPGAGGARVVGAQRRARAPPHHEAAAGGAEGIVQLGASKGNVRSAGLQRGARGGEEGRGWMFDGGRGGEEGRGSRPCGTMRRSERQLSTCVNRSCKPTSPRPALRHARSQCTSPAAAPRTRRGHARHPPTRRAPLPLSPD